MTFALAGVPLWVWLFLAAIFVGIPAVVIGCALALRAIASRSLFRHAGERAGAARTHARQVTRSGLGGLVIGLLVGLALVLSQRGVFAPVACAAGYLLGLLVAEYSAQPPAWGVRRAATLLARRAIDYVPRLAAWAIAVTTVLTLAIPIAFALAPPVSYGPWQPAPGVGFSLPAGQTAWPGLMVTLGGAAPCVAALLLGAAGLRRVAARPQPADRADLDIDVAQRRQAGRAIAGALLGLQLIALAALLIAGSSGLAVPVPSISPFAYLGSRIMIWAGLCCAASGAASWLLLSGWIRWPRRADGGSPAEPGSGSPQPGGGSPEPGSGSAAGPGGRPAGAEG